MSNRRPSLSLLASAWPSLLAGAGLGLLLFGWETAALLRSGAVGFSMDTDGPFAAVFAAVRPELPWLLGRILAVYLMAGGALGLVAAAATAALPPLSRGGRRVAFALELSFLVALLAWSRAIARPALLDDVLPRALLELLVNAGQPWHPQLAAGVFAAAHLALALRRYGRSFGKGLAVAATVTIALGAANLAGVSRSAHRLAPHPLVVLVGLDAFRPDRLEALGGPSGLAPHLERFLADATRFDRAYTPIAQTEPAWRSLVTARWPFVTGSRYPLTPRARWTELPTFPAALSRAGFQTSFQTDCSRFNFLDARSGFEERRQPPFGAINFALEKLRYRFLGMVADHRLGAALLPELVENRALAGIYDPLGYAQRMAGRLGAAAERGPLLFSYHATAAHFPGDPVFPFYRRYVSQTAPLERRLRMFFAPVSMPAPVAKEPPSAPQATSQAALEAVASAPPAWTRHSAEALYDELLSQADAQLGILLDELRARGLYDEATIVVFSDHGESFHADRPDLQGATPVHGSRLGEDENRILLAIKAPRSLSGGARVASVDALVRLIDVGPTVLDLLGLPPLPGADGVSLLPWMSPAARPGASLPSLKLYAETGFTHVSPDVFAPGHAATAPRTFHAYRVHADGVVELTDEAHSAVLAEKDLGAFDGQSWLVRAPGRDGGLTERCSGRCDAPSRRALSEWLDSLLGSPEARATPTTPASTGGEDHG